METDEKGGGLWNTSPLEGNYLDRRTGMQRQRMSDRRKSRMSCPPLRPRRLGSCSSLPKDNLILGWKHLAVHCTAFKISSTAV